MPTQSDIQFYTTAYFGATITLKGVEYGFEYEEKFNWNTKTFEDTYKGLVFAKPKETVEVGASLYKVFGAKISLGLDIKKVTTEFFEKIEEAFEK